MIKFYADWTELSERDTSIANLKRLRFLSFVSLPFTPLLGIVEGGILVHPILITLAVTTLIVSGIALLFLFFSKLAMRVWVRDKYLDEWELKIKHRSMAFAFQALLWVLGITLGFGTSLLGSNVITLPRLSILHVGYIFFALMMFTLYAQLFAQFVMTKPIEEDEFDMETGSRRSLNGALTVIGVIVGFVVIPPFVLGITEGYKTEPKSELEILAYEAKSVCETGGSRVHWVSTEKDNFGFACFDENKALPESLTGNDPNSQE